MSDNTSVTMTAAEYLQRTTADAECHTPTDADPGLMPFPGAERAPEAVVTDDRSLARAFMAAENADGRCLRFSNRDLLWTYDSNSGTWRRLSAGDTRAFLGRLYEFVFAHLSTTGETDRCTARYRSVRQILFETVDGYCVDPDSFDRDHDLIAFANGVYDLASGELRPHSPDHMLTIGRHHDFDPQATCPRFERFLDEVLVRHVDPADEYSPLVPDPELRLLIQEMMGYCLATHCRAERAFFLAGEGRNGKSKLIEVIRQVVGRSNVADFDLRDLAKEQMRLSLMGRLLAVQTELDAGTTIPDGRFKALVSGEAMTAKEVYRAPVSFEPS